MSNPLKAVLEPESGYKSTRTHMVSQKTWIQTRSEFSDGNIIEVKIEHDFRINGLRYIRKSFVEN